MAGFAATRDVRGLDVQRPLALDPEQLLGRDYRVRVRLARDEATEPAPVSSGAPIVALQ